MKSSLGAHGAGPPLPSASPWVEAEGTAGSIAGAGHRAAQGASAAGWWGSG